MEKFLSIIIPVYNVEDYIEECLNSLLLQDFNKNFYEIICVDDGSTDNSGKICDKFAKQYENIKVFHTQNGGVSVARNIGIGNARGSYIWFIDADDYVENDCLNGIYNNLSQSNPDVLIFNFSYNKEGVLEKRAYGYKTGYVDRRVAINGLFDYKKWNGFIWNKIVKMQFIKRSRFNETLFMIEDLEFFTRIFLLADTFLCLETSYYIYRLRAVSLSHSFSEKKLTSFKAYDLILNNFNDRKKYKKVYTVINSAKVNFSKSILIYYYKNDKEKYKQTKNIYKKIIAKNLWYCTNIKTFIGAVVFLIFTKTYVKLM